MENKTGKYLKYAIGEIILVVIGILLALQINNWNEQKKSDRFEVKMLKEIKKSIEDDNIYLQMILDYRIKIIDTTSIALMKMLKEKEIDSVKFNTYSTSLNMGFIFHYNDGAYEALKASGIDKVTSDSLRNALIHFYDFAAPRAKQLIVYHSNDNTHQLLNELRWQVFDHDVVGEGEDLYFSPIRYKLKSFHDQRFLNYLDLKSNEASNAKHRISNFIRDSKKVLTLLEKDLKKEYK